MNRITLKIIGGVIFLQVIVILIILFKYNDTDYLKMLDQGSENLYINPSITDIKPISISNQTCIETLKRDLSYYF